MFEAAELTFLNIIIYSSNSCYGRTCTGGEFGWGGTSVKIHHRCPKIVSIRTEILCGLKREKTVLLVSFKRELTVKAWLIDPFKVIEIMLRGV